MIEKTLTDKVLSVSSAKAGKVSVKVPRLNVRKKTPISKKENMHVSSIVNILIKAAVEKAKKEKKEKASAEETKGYAVLSGEKAAIRNSYGASSKSYGSAPHVSYIDYGKIFSYLGKFRSQSEFENFVSDSHVEMVKKRMEQDNKFYLLDNEIIDDGVRAIKYFTPGNLAGEIGAVPMAGINSSDWEKFKLWKIVDYVMFNLKMSTL